MMEYKKLTDDELADFLQRACVQLVPELTKQLLSLGSELAEYRTKIGKGTLIEIPEGALVLTREYYESEAYVCLIENELCKKCRERVAEAYEKIRKETAERIYKLADEIATGSQNDGVNILCAIKKEFGL